jgi:hypothetical protein
MTAPTLPSLPPELREKIDALVQLTFAAGKYPDGESQEAEQAERARIELDDALLPYVQDAERFRWMDENPYAIRP